MYSVAERKIPAFVENLTTVDQAVVNHFTDGAVWPQGGIRNNQMLVQFILNTIRGINGFFR